MHVNFLYLSNFFSLKLENRHRHKLQLLIVIAVMEIVGLSKRTYKKFKHFCNWKLKSMFFSDRDHQDYEQEFAQICPSL